MDGEESLVDAGAIAFPPRAVTWVETLLFEAGARLDRLVFDLAFGRRAFPGLDDAMRRRLARGRAFYGDPRFMRHPDTFFLPPSLPLVRERRLRPLIEGDVLELVYTTDFQPVFPDGHEELGPVLERPGVARWWRHRGCGHPAVLCIHGYAGGQLWLESLAFDAHRFYRAGLDVVLYVLPYHGARRLAGVRRSGDGFFGVDLVRTNEAFAQAIYELRALLRYLHAGETGPVGAFGMSLGGYMTALLAAVEPSLAFAVPMIPLASLSDMMWRGGERHPRVVEAMAEGWTLGGLRDFFRVHAPLARQPLVPHARRLIIGALGDRICPPRHTDALWRHWGRPRIHWYPGGHLAQFRRSAALREVRALLRAEGLLPPAR